MIQNIDLKIGWNLVSIIIKKNINDIISNKDILEIKNYYKSYNSKIPLKFNSLKELEPNKKYWIKTKKSLKLSIYEDKKIETYDIVIVGAGPAGCMLSRVLADSDKFKNKKILLIEKGSYDIIEHYNKKYRDLLNWSDAMNDPMNSNTITSKNDKTIWLGEGLGGGTLHFGMQYIDQVDLYKDIPKIKYYLDKVNKITKTQRFDYSKDDDKLWHGLYTLFNDDKNINFYNNKIYSRDISNSTRFIAFDLLKDKDIEFKTNTVVKKIEFKNNIATEIVLENDEKIKFNKLILTSGAIENVKILNNSPSPILEKLDIGKTIFDHAGVNFYYIPTTNENFSKFIEIGHLQIRSKDLKWQIYFTKVPNVPFLVVTIAQAKRETNNGYVKFDGDKHEIFIKYFNDFDKPETLVDAYEYVNSKLNQLGFVNTEQKEINKDYILKAHDSIYHYHGTCPFNKVVDESQKVIGIENLYIGDISVLENCVPGSTSVSSMSTGYRLGKILGNPKIPDIEKEIQKLEEENKELNKQKENLYTTERLKKLWKEENKMFVTIQNDGSYVGKGDKKVYDMGNYWKGGGHRGGSLTRYLEDENYDFTKLLSNRHGSYSAWRLQSGGAKEMGLFDDGSIDKEIEDNNKLIEEMYSKNF